ncbi:MAG: ABC transporter substrate-binding protein [Deltaproteobacteria bacterium]|nr:ABC transporter substrate-binding protein [Deltaproteobacteria bacterium]
MIKKTALCVLTALLLLGAAAPGLAATGIDNSTKTVYLGGYDSVTGKYGDYGLGNKRGQEIAIEEINGNGGIASGPLKGYKLSLAFNDDRGDPKEAANIAKKLSAGNYLAVLGPTMSSCALAASPIYYRNGVPNIITYAQAVTITTQGFNNIARLTYTTKSVAVHMANKIKQEFGKKRVSIISENQDYGQQLLATMKEMSKDLGIEIVSESVIVPGQDIDFKSILVQAKSKNPDMLLLFLTYNEAGLLVKQCRGMGWTVPVYGPNSLTEPKFFELAGNLGEFYLTLSPTLDVNRPDAKGLVTKWAEKYQGIPPMAAIYGYDAVKVAARVIEMGGVDRDGFIKKLKEVKMNGIGAPVYEFDKAGEVKTPALITVTGESFAKENIK